MGFKVDIVAHSISPIDKEIITFSWTFPRPILAEVNTHRDASKNSASSRAIPFSRVGKRKPGQSPTILEMVMEDPYLPIFYGKNEPGMQAWEELSADDVIDCKRLILVGRDKMVEMCKQLWEKGLHKQDTNRYLEPWLWCTQVVTTTNLSNLFTLRTHKDAHPAFRYLSRLLYLKYRRSVPTRLNWGEWHLPYVKDDEKMEYMLLEKEQHGDKWELQKLSTVRCARVSYLNHEGVYSLANDLSLYGKLAGGYPKHASPFEHSAQPLPTKETQSNFYYWLQYRKYIPGEVATTFSPTEAEIAAWMIECGLV